MRWATLYWRGGVDTFIRQGGSQVEREYPGPAFCLVTGRWSQTNCAMLTLLLTLSTEDVIAPRYPVREHPQLIYTNLVERNLSIAVCLAG
jgi:hypothetical protein